LFWKDHEAEFPALASLARDILSIPATGAGVERLFNSARDICHYRRGSLKSTTIQDLMMYMCTSRFEAENERLALAKEFLSSNEIEAGVEEHDAQDDENLEPISDDEEDEVSSVIVPSQQAMKAASKIALGKRPSGITSEPENEGENSGDEVDLPLVDTQLRASGRVRKRPKLLDGYEVSI
jgi:hAT family dimerisation domain.